MMVEVSGLTVKYKNVVDGDNLSFEVISMRYPIAKKCAAIVRNVYRHAP